MADPKMKLWSPVPPQQAIEFFENKDLLPTWSYKDIWRHQHANAFVVAKCSDLDLLREFHQSIDHAMKKGWSYNTWYKNMAPAMQKRGWWGKGEAYNPNTGQWETAQLGSPRRAKIIFLTNMRNIKAAGRWAKMSELNKNQTRYLQYRALRFGNRRADHQDKQGIILPMDHPFWDFWYPPNGWNCKCTVRSYTKKQLERRGLSVSTPPKVPMVTTKNPLTGQMETIPRGIAPAFAYNVGQSYMTNMRGVLLEKARQLETIAKNAVLLKAVFSDWVYSKPGTEVIAYGKTNQEFVVVGYIDEERRKDIPVDTSIGEHFPKTGIVIMTGKTADKQRNHHPKLLAAHYGILQEMMDKGDFKKSTSRHHYTIDYVLNGKGYRAVIKIADKPKGREIFLVSLTEKSRLNRKYKRK